MKKIKLLCLVLLPLLFAWSCKNESGMPAGNWGFVVSIEGSKQGDSLSVEYGRRTDNRYRDKIDFRQPESGVFGAFYHADPGFHTLYA